MMSSTLGPRESSPASSLGGLFITPSREDVPGTVLSRSVRDKRIAGEGFVETVGSGRSSGTSEGVTAGNDWAGSGLGLLPPHSILPSTSSACSMTKSIIPSLITTPNTVLPIKPITYHTPTSSTSSSLTTTTTTTTTPSSIEQTPTLDPTMMEGSTDDDDSTALLSPADDLGVRREPVRVVGYLSPPEGSSWGERFLDTREAGSRDESGMEDGQDGWMVNTFPRSFASLPKKWGSKRKERNARGLRVDVRKAFKVETSGTNGDAEKPVDSTYSSSLGPTGGSLRVNGRNRLGMGLRLGINTDLHRSGRAVSHASTNSPNVEMRNSLGFKINSESHTKPAYHDGPVEVVKGVWIGNEESVMRFEKWVGEGKKGMVVNVAKELSHPFETAGTRGQAEEGDETLREEQSRIKTYPAENGRPAITYLKLDWTHGETELAEIGSTEDEKCRWGFDKTIRAMEVARKEGVPILIHCQCGISRSATLVIAYLVYLSHYDLLPPNTDGLYPKSTMWQVNDYVKEKSEWTGPNVLLICQLLEWEKALNSRTTESTSTHVTPSPGPRSEHSPTNTSLQRDIQSFAKREAEDLDERMRARTSKRRKSDAEGAEGWGEERE